MARGLKYRLSITDIEEYSRTGEMFHCTEVVTFFRLQDVWEYLGFKLKRERCGWAGMTATKLYVLERMA